MNGIIVVDKPSGWTSHDVVAKLRGSLKVRRVGHGGTLDPMATGVLPVFLGRATRAAEFCGNADKEYIAGLKLGVVTDTHDITGNVTGVNDATVTKKELLDVIPRFIGSQEQIPPMYSAIKRDGKKLYELARRGIDVPRPAREIDVSDIELLDSGDDGVLLRIVCSKGTYIRTLCNDIGAALGCGGTMSSLRRIRAGVFTVDVAHTLDAVLDAVSETGVEAMIRPVDSLFSEYPPIVLDDGNADRCRHGAAVQVARRTDGRYRFYARDGEFLMLGETDGGAVRVLKNFFGTDDG